MLFSPTPESIKNIPTPHKEPPKTKFTLRHDMPSSPEMEQQKPNIKFSEISQSMKKIPPPDKSEKLEIVSYQQKRSEYRIKNHEIIRTNTQSSFNLMGNLQNLDVSGDNTTGAKFSPLKTSKNQPAYKGNMRKNYQSFIDPTQSGVKFTTYNMRRKEKSMGRAIDFTDKDKVS